MKKHMSIFLFGHLVLLFFWGQFDAIAESEIRYTVFKEILAMSSNQQVKLLPGVVLKQLDQKNESSEFLLEVLEPASLRERTRVLRVEQDLFNKSTFSDGGINLSVLMPVSPVKEEETPVEVEAPNVVENTPSKTISDEAADKVAARLKQKGYEVFPIRKKLDIIYSPGRSINRSMMSDTCDVMMNGTFFYANKPVAWVYDGTYHSQDYPSSWTNRRGYLAQFSDGELELGLIPGNIDPSSSGIRNYLENKHAKTLTGFVGGAGFIVGPDYNGDGKAIDSDNLYLEQGFRQGGSGINAAQFRWTNHGMLASVKGHVFGVVNNQSKSGRQMQSDFVDAGFDHVVKLDGGSGVVLYKKGSGYIYGGTNYSGLCIQLKE